MKLVRALLMFLLFIPASALAQGVRMSPDFLPLAVGNRWVYDVSNEDGKKIGELDMAVQEHTIISGRSFYVFSQFPFVSATDESVRLVRYDRQERQFLRIAHDEEGALFLADGSSTDVVQADTSGLPQKFILNLDTMALTFQRGVGIVEARLPTPDGIRIARIKTVRLGGSGMAVGISSPGAASAAGLQPAGPPETPEQKKKGLVDNVTMITEENPRLELEATPSAEGHKFVLTVTNTSEKLLPFHFTSGQSYDFVVIDPATGQEIWRWSRRMFFSQVIRDEAIRSRGNWKFEGVWNHLDNNLSPVSPGQYRIVGMVFSQPPVETEPAILEVK